MQIYNKINQSQQFYYLIYLLLMYIRNGWDYRLMSWCLPQTIHTGCIRKNCAVGSSVIISDSERLSSPEVYQMKADIRMQKFEFFFMRIRLKLA